MAFDPSPLQSGREVKVSLYSSPKESSKLSWALQSVLKAMKWDEERFGREYQYDEFRVVCVHAFNAGAMENTSLNIFNCSILLADPKTSSGKRGFVVSAVSESSASGRVSAVRLSTLRRSEPGRVLFAFPNSVF